MHTDLLAMLRCPDCAEPFEFVPAAAGAEQFGVLRCGRHAFPVIDGIPVIRHGRVSVLDHMSEREDVPGPTVTELVDLVEKGSGVEALVRLLSFPPNPPFGLERVPGARLPFTRWPGSAIGMRIRRAEVRRALRTVESQTAQEWMRRCYLRSRNVTSEFYPYFLHRFAQPRYLATLTLLSILPESTKPVLDLACGFGHVMFHLAAREHPVSAIGVDRNFFQLWIGSKFIAPAQRYVCADAAVPLPFADDVFSASVCTDAFHLFPDAGFSLAQLRRCAEHETVILDRVANGLLEPHDVDNEPTPDGYRALIGEAANRIVGQDQLVENYLAGHGPRLANHIESGFIDKQKWLSIISRDNDDLYVDHANFPYPPHAMGPLALNPIYRRAKDGLRLTFHFPSTWFEFENRQMADYHAQEIVLTPAQIQAIRRGHPAPELRELIDKYVVLAMPERYCR